jgi:hypothetical protein
VESCLVVVAAAIVWRLWHERRRQAAWQHARSIAALPETSGRLVSWRLNKGLVCSKVKSLF